MAKTSEDILVELLAALEEAKQVLREIHVATKDFKQMVKVERARHEEIVREETRDTVMKIATDIHKTTSETVNQILAELRKQLLGEEQ